MSLESRSIPVQVHAAPSAVCWTDGNVHLGFGYIDAYVDPFLLHEHLLRITGPSLQDAGSVGPGNLYDQYARSICLLAGQAGRARRRQLGEPGSVSLGCTVEQYDTPLAALVAPNGYMGLGPASTSVEDTGIIKPGG